MSNFQIRACRYWIVALVISCAVEHGLANDDVWPQFRGANANPVAENANLPQRWSINDNVEWSTEIPGRGWSSPVVSGGFVFLTTTLTEGESKLPQTGTEFSNDYVRELTEQGLSQEEILEKVTNRDIELPAEVNLEYVLYCLELETGKIVWHRTYHKGKPQGGRHRKNSFTSETPVTDGKHVFVYSTGLGIFAFDFAGNQIWSQPLEAHPIYLEFGTGSSPVLVDDRLIILNDNQEKCTLSAWNKNTGEKLWEVSRDSFPERQSPLIKSCWVTPYVWKNSMRTEIIAPGALKVTSYDLDGNELWEMQGMGMGLAASSFAVGDNLLVNGGRGRPIYCIKPGAAGDISLQPSEETNEYVVWSRPRAGTYIPTPVAYDGALYVLSDNGILARLDLTNQGFSPN